MPRSDNEIRITPSVLDRLLDFEPTVSTEAPKSRAKSLRELKQSVKRDLEWLLNSRSYLAYEIDDSSELAKSVACYGLLDFTGLAAKNPAEQKRLSKTIESIIRRFEPRFMDLKVTFEPPTNLERVFRFRIDARLKVEPAPEPIVFDTVLELGSGEYLVTEK